MLMYENEFNCGRGRFRNISVRIDKYNLGVGFQEILYLSRNPDRR